MTLQEKKKIKEKIASDIATLTLQIKALEEKNMPVATDCSLDDLTRTETINAQEINHKILDESRLRLTRLKNALLRIDKPMFGICIECEEEIGFGRMSIRPESVRCVSCANTSR